MCQWLHINYIYIEPQRVFFDPTSYSVNENAGSATITVRTDVPGGPPDGAVEFYTEDLTATGWSLTFHAVSLL